MGFFDDITGGIGSVTKDIFSPVGDFASGVTGGLFGSFYEQQANAAQAIAEAQLAQQKQTQQQALKFAKPTENELTMLKNQMELYTKIQQQNESYLESQNKLAAAINPNIISAAQQAYQLLQGGQSAATAPIMAQRQQQRAQLQSQLASQLGSGWATSTAGIQAMNNFDNQSQQLQYGMMGSLLQYSSGFRPDIGGDISRTASVQSGLAGNYLGEQNAISARQISALIGTNLTPYAGASNIGNLVQGQYQAQMGSQLFGMLTGMAGNYAGTQMSGQAYQQYMAPTSGNPYSSGGSYMNGPSMVPQNMAAWQGGSGYHL